LIAMAAQPDQFPRDGLPEIALAGRSNVGKSSFINRMLGRRRLAYTEFPSRQDPDPQFLPDQRAVLFCRPARLRLCPGVQTATGSLGNAHRRVFATSPFPLSCHSTCRYSSQADPTRSANVGILEVAPISLSSGGHQGGQGFSRPVAQTSSHDSPGTGHGRPSAGLPFFRPGWRRAARSVESHRRDVAHRW